MNAVRALRSALFPPRTPFYRCFRSLVEGDEPGPADLWASEGRSITTTEKLLLFCYHYDPQGKRYALVAMNVMRLGGGVTVVLMGGFLTIMWRRERRRQMHRVATAHRTAGATSS